MVMRLQVLSNRPGLDEQLFVGKFGFTPEQSRFVSVLVCGGPKCVCQIHSASVKARDKVQRLKFGPRRLPVRYASLLDGRTVLARWESRVRLELERTMWH